MTVDGGWPELLAAYATEQRARGASPETIRTRLSYLRRWAGQHLPDAPRVELVEWLAQPGWAPGTRKSAQGALRSFYRWAVRAGHLEHDPAADLDPVAVPKRLPRPAAEWQVAAGKAAADPDTALMVELAAHAGLRRAEIARARREDLTADGRLFVRGKGGKDRVIPLNPHTRRAVEARPGGWLFPGRFSGHVHPATVQKHVKAAAGVSPHPLRHRFATRAYAGTRNLFAVQEVLGHESPETSRVYVALADDALLEAVMAAA